MAVPTFFAAGAGVAAASGTSVTATLPTSTLADDIAITIGMYNSASTLSVSTTGWATVVSATNNANMSWGWWWKRLVGGDIDPAITSSVAGSASNGIYGRTYVYRGCVTTGTPFEATTPAGAPTSSTTPLISAATSLGTDRLGICLAAIDDDNTWASGFPPTGWASSDTGFTSTTGGDARLDAVHSTSGYSSSSITQVNMGTMSAADFWATMTMFLIPPAVGPAVEAVYPITARTRT